MDIVLPIKKGEETDKLVSGVINMVVVGANGAGKLFNDAIGRSLQCGGF